MFFLGRIIMEKSRLLIVSSILLSLPLFASNAQVDHQAPEVQDIAKVYQLAQKNNAQYMAAEAEFKAKQENVPIALGQLLPNITLSYTAQESYTSDPSAVRSKYFTQTPSINASQILFNWSTWQAYSAASYQAKADAITFAQAQQNLIVSVAEAYLTILQSQDNVAYAKANTSWNKELLNQTEEKYKVGLSAITDVQAIKAQYEQAVADNVQTENDLATAYTKLLQITGTEITAIEDLRADFPFNKPEPATIEEWLEIALKENLTIVENQYKLEVAKKNTNAAWGAFIPSASLTASGTRKLDYKNPGFTVGTNAANAAIGAQWNIINGGGDYAATKQKKYIKNAAEYTLLEAKRSTESALKTAYLTVLSDISKVEAYKQAVIAAEASVAAMKAGYDVGTRTIVDLLNQQQQLFNAQKEYSQARYAYINDLLTLKRQAGTLSYHDIDAINNWLAGKQKMSPSTAIAQQKSVKT